MIKKITAVYPEHTLGLIPIIITKVGVARSFNQWASKCWDSILKIDHDHLHIHPFNVICIINAAGGDIKPQTKLTSINMCE
jgi:hypothetical protein